MNFTRVKSFICLCLLIVNIVFLFMCVNLLREKNYISEEEAVLAQRHLSSKGVEVSFDKEARRLYYLPIYACTADRDSEKVPQLYVNITEAFFGTDIDAGTFVKTPNGYSVSVKGSDGKLLGVASGASTYYECYTDGAVTPEDITEIAKTPYLAGLKNVKNDSTELARKFVSAAFSGYGVKYEYDGERDYADGKIVCFLGVLSDTKILNNYINVYVKKGKLLCCVGNITENAPQRKYSSELIDSIDLMYLIPDYVAKKDYIMAVEGITIDSFRMRYKMYEYGLDEYYLIPTWVLEYSGDGGTKEIITVDAVTGENISELK